MQWAIQSFVGEPVRLRRPAPAFPVLVANMMVPESNEYSSKYV